ncbi:MAG: hypothetical protein L3J74_17590 [Bacteroidales bacterium]|nr:hypothetical protein [Bacteroidales bacterium]
MKKLFLTLLLASLIFACNDDEGANDNVQQDKLPADVPIEEITSSVNNQEIKKEEETKTQINTNFRQFIDKFQHTSLPYELNPDFDDNEPENIYAKIPLETQIKYLAKAEKLSKSDFEEMADYTDFYYVNSPLQTNRFTAVIYGRFEMGSVYFYLCTYNNEGNLISSIDFASFNMLGAGPQAGRYTITKGKIDKNLKVTVTFTDIDENTSVEKYLIKENGKIVKQ